MKRKRHKPPEIAGESQEAGAALSAGLTETENYREVLFRDHDDYPADKLADHRIEQYKLYLEMADRISARRQIANSYFFTLNTALLLLAGYLSLGAAQLVAIMGIVLSYMWYRLVRSSEDINTAKFKIIHEIEVKLPMAPYAAEWEAVGRGKNPKLYCPFTHIEICAPLVFLALHALVILLWIIPWGTILMTIWAFLIDGPFRSKLG